jgi:hypothetical protein
MTIVSELYMQEMSPTQFKDKFGGGSYGKILGHFKRLEEHGWIRWVRTAEPSGRGRPQGLYRATELAVVDDDTWAELPLSIQAAFTARTLQQLGERIGDAIEGGTLECGRKPYLACRTVPLDEEGWTEALQTLTDFFRLSTQVQTDAKLRLEKSGERPILLTIALAGFEAPGDHLKHRSWSSAEINDAGSKNDGLRLNHSVPLTTRLAKVFSDPLLLRITRELSDSAMSATELEAKLGGASVWSFDRKCKLLTDLGWLTKVDRKTGGIRRGATEHFYAATGPQVIDTEVWDGIPEAARAGDDWPTLGEFCCKATEALACGTFNARSDRHLTWFTLLLDDLGWKQLIAGLDRCSHSLRDVEQTANRRLDGSVASLSATLFLGGFESPAVMPVLP